MERREPSPQPPAPDRGGVPLTLIAFACAALIVVAAVAVVALTGEAWAVVFAIGVLVVLLAIVLWMVELDLGRGESPDSKGDADARGGA